MKRRKTRNPAIWFAYWCWCVQFWMACHTPYWPMPVRHWAYRRYGENRYGLTWRQIAQWRRVRPDWQPTAFPLPWWLGAYALGPFQFPWRRVQRWFRDRTGGRSHRCEFTDREHGALYGHREGPFMDAFFEQLIANVSVDGDD